MMEQFKKAFGRPARQGKNSLEYRGLQEVDKVHEQAVRLLTELKVSSYSIEKVPQLRGFIINFF